MPTTRMTTCGCVLWLALAAAQAQPASAPEAAPVCREDGNQQEMYACALQDFQRADAALNARYQAALQALPAERQAQLRHSQRQWLRQRDPTCQARARRYQGGSIWPLVFYSCLAESTQARLHALP